MKAQAEKIPTYTVTKLHTEGRSIFPSRDMVLAFPFNTPLSIRFFLEELAPMLEPRSTPTPPRTELPGS